jgi:hypothetical protein
MFGIKHVARTTFNRLGYKISKQEKQSFPKLPKLSRYTPTLKINGNYFDITDAASFLTSYNEIFKEKI